jgi:mRNA-degrading endonuclease toxin of MazEF toxin-antitoxin module
LSRNPVWNVDRNFVRGEVYFVNLPSEPSLEPDDSYVLEGDHRVIVLYDSDYPRNTVTILPISSLYDDEGIKKETIATDYELIKEEYESAERPYNGTIKKDSFIKMEQIRSISRHYLERKVGKVIPEDMLLIDLRLIAALQLQDTVSKLVESEVLHRLNVSSAEKGSTS